jgi:S-DNA-T family DNA segregation ATPase FtsK/SpoIIIE
MENKMKNQKSIKKSEGEVAVRRCKECNFLTDRKRCPLCDEKTKVYNISAEADKKRKALKRFPRLLSPQDEEQQRVIKVIEDKTALFECPGIVVGVKAGPMVTEYEFQPERFTRVKRLRNLNEDLAVAIPAESVSVVRAAGKAAMTITVPNKERQEVSFSGTLKNVIAHRKDMELPINLGVTSTGDPMVVDLVKIPHLLIAGSTGTGKSVLLNTILTSLLYCRSPKDLELILIDPKAVELLPYSGLPHVKREPVSGVMEALALLDTVTQEMKRRMAFLYFNKVKNLGELNEKLRAAGKPEECLPYWVIVIDEIGDLILNEKKLTTKALAEISSMARAAGIHIIAATQRPSVDVLSGKIKVNFPARIGLRLPSAADSKTVFGRSGAEQLLGKGDMFVMHPEMPGLVRVHAPHCTRADINRMLELSLELGHVLKVPADGVPFDNGTPKANGNGKAKA